MNGPPKKPPRNAVLAWIKANPDATDEEIRAYANGLMAPASGRFTTALHGITKGLTLGLNDEIAGTLGGLVDTVTGNGKGLVQNVKSNIAEQRDIERGGRIEHPVVSIGSEVVGGLGLGGGTGAMLSKGEAIASLLGGGKLAGQIAGGALGGAAFGAASGFGNAEGNPLERLPGAGWGAAGGAVVGGGLPLLVSGAAGLSNAVGLTPLIKRAIDALRPSAGLQGQTADNLVLGAMQRDQMTPAGLAEARGLTPTTATPQNPDVPTAMIELAGPNTRKLFTEAQLKGGAPAQHAVEGALEARGATEARSGRVDTRLREILNPEDADIAETGKSLMEVRKEHAKLLYQQAKGVPVEHPEIRDFMNLPEVRRAYQAFRKNQIDLKKPADEIPPDIYKAIELPPALQGDTPAAKALRKKFKLQDEAIPSDAIISVEQAVKSWIAGASKSSDKTVRDRAAVIQQRLVQAMDKADDMIPNLRLARSTYSNDSANLDALGAGRGRDPKRSYGRNIPNFAKSDAAAIQKWVAQTEQTALSGGEGADQAQQLLEMYRLGSYGYLRELAKKAANPETALNRTALKEKIRAVFNDDETAKQFETALMREIKNQKSGGLQQRGVPEESGIDRAADIAIAGTGLASGRLFGSAVALGRLFRGESKMTPGSAQAVVDRLMSGVKNPEDFAAALRALAEAEKKNAAKAVKRVGRYSGVAAGTVGAASH